MAELREESRGAGTYRQNIIASQIAAMNRELQRLRDALPNTGLGHSDFPGGDEFDWNLEDDDWFTGPYNPAGGTEHHFRMWMDSERDVDEAIEYCDRDAFVRAIHRGQDYWSHYLQGYRYEFPMEGGHAYRLRFPIWFYIRPAGYGVQIDGGYRWPVEFPGTSPDDAVTHRREFEEAAAWTATKLAQWKCKCGNGR